MYHLPETTKLQHNNNNKVISQKKTFDWKSYSVSNGVLNLVLLIFFCGCQENITTPERFIEVSNKKETIREIISQKYWKFVNHQISFL